MRILVVGGTGTIGKAVVDELSPRHEVIIASSQRANIKVDIQDPHSIENMYKTVGSCDAVISTLGKVHFGEFAAMTPELFEVGLKNKLMGQVNLVLVGMRYLADNGSFTLTSGILNHDPIRLGSGAAMANGALDGFVTSAALELPRGLRINIVSPSVVAESMDKYAGYFRGYFAVSAHEVALAYSKSVEGAQTGKIYKVGY